MHLQYPTEIAMKHASGQLLHSTLTSFMYLLSTVSQQDEEELLHAGASLLTGRRYNLVESGCHGPLKKKS